ncbi:hypothetical protein GPECTOR_840g76 [Gonium pectorale]|uniref:Uncharacterized protein n=1 Tax=Gonium pectorale TaxID=33097 RepID=A0A150FTZ7_GONPE|nr:hypothetical protein GPECTOR_840g76 [Gonium pectorale]|eukprot:KXZ41079.1 hypothetical protein GPECTOR_840g76 [Gonium pectorale]
MASKLWHSNSVHPTGDPLAPSRRVLERNSRDANKMLVVAGLYSLFIVIFYSVAYATLLQVKHLVALQTVADFNAERTYRAVFYAQELVCEEDPAVIPTRVSALRNATLALRDAYYTMRMGAQAMPAAGTTEHFWLVEGGLVREAPPMFKLFYAEDACLRLEEHMPCPGPDYRFYQVTRSGADGMMLAFLGMLARLADEVEAAAAMLVEAGGNVAAANASLPGLGSAAFDFVLNVGIRDLNDANLRIASEHLGYIRRVFKVVVVMHVVLCLLLATVFLGFVFYIYLPLLRRMHKEVRRVVGSARRIAEMMSQLPPELDVMRLVIGGSNTRVVSLSRACWN